MEKILFKEEQRFNQWWIWLILIVAIFASLGPLAYGIYYQEVIGEPWGNNPASTETLIYILIFTFLVMVGVFAMIWIMKLKIKITYEGIWFHFPPMINKWRFIKKEEVDRYEIRTYKPNLEFGGYGWKGLRKKRAMIIKGNTGLQLYLKDGKKLLIGTQRKQAINTAMRKMMEE